MKREPMITGWTTGRINRSGEHFYLRYGNAKDESVSKSPLVALVGPPVEYHACGQNEEATVLPIRETSLQAA
jgi:hypothetical protein